MVKDQKRDFEALYQRYYPGILVFLCFLIDSLEGAEDLASLVFEKALVHSADIQTIDTAGPWLYRIARNCATDYYRRRKPSISLEHLPAEEHPQLNATEEIVEADNEQQRLRAHLKQLSEREQVVIGLKFVANLNNREIARVLQIPEGTVGSLLYRALHRLRAALNEDGEHTHA